MQTKHQKSVPVALPLDRGSFPWEQKLCADVSSTTGKDVSDPRYRCRDNLRSPIAPTWGNRALLAQKGPNRGPSWAPNSKEKWILIILDRNGVKSIFDSCFLDVSDLADILGMTVWFFGFLIFDHVRPSSSPGSQHFFFSGHICPVSYTHLRAHET